MRMMIWERTPLDQEGLRLDWMLVSRTPFLTRYELDWEHPGEGELKFSRASSEYSNFNQVVEKYKDVVSGAGPHWNLSYSAGEGDDAFVFLGHGTREDMVVLARVDYASRIKAAMSEVDVYQPGHSS